MKKGVLTGVTALFVSFSGYACDICGCGVGNYYIGILPQFHRTFFGLRYQLRKFHTQLASDKTQFSNDVYQSVELWSGWNIGKKWQVLAFVPYNMNKQNSDDGITRSHGLGDIAVLGNYKIFDLASTDRQKHLISQQLWLGAGIKLPTGKFEIDPAASDLVAVANSQLGSGSTDFMLNSMYNVRINKVGINSTINYKVNTKNSEHYQFGNKFTANSFAYYVFGSGNLNLAPNIGLMYEHSDANKLNKQKIHETGGHVALAAAGVELSFHKVSIGINMQIPFTQNFAMGQTHTRTRAMIHMSAAL